MPLISVQALTSETLGRFFSLNYYYLSLLFLLFIAKGLKEEIRNNQNQSTLLIRGRKLVLPELTFLATEGINNA